MELILKRPGARYRSGGNINENKANKLSSKEQRALKIYFRQKHFNENYHRIEAVRDEVRRNSAVR